MVFPKARMRRMRASAGLRRPQLVLPLFVTAASDAGEFAARHARVFAGGLTLTDPAHQATLDELRGGSRRAREPEVQLRPLAPYDALIQGQR